MEIFSKGFLFDDESFRTIFQKAWSSALIYGLFSREKNHVDNRKWLPLVIDGPVGAGSSTQVELWKETFGFNSLQMGEIFRVISIIAIDNNLKADEVIQAAKTSGLTISISDIEGERAYYISLNTENAQIEQVVKVSQVSDEVHSPEVTAYVSHLNSDQFRAVEQVILGALRPYLEHATGLVLEGRNLAFVTNVPHAYYVAVSDESAQERVMERERKRLEKGGRAVTDDLLQMQANLVLERNKRDMQNGILMTREQALVAPEYTAVFNSDLAAAERVFVSMVILHDLISENPELTGLNAAQLWALRYIVGYDDRTEQTTKNSLAQVNLSRSRNRSVKLS